MIEKSGACARRSLDDHWPSVFELMSVFIQLGAPGQSRPES